MTPLRDGGQTLEPWAGKVLPLNQIDAFVNEPSPPAPGDHVPSEAALQQQFGVSRKQSTVL